MKKDIKNIDCNFNSKFTDFEVMNKEFTKCRCYALASGDNVNGNNITEESIDKAIERGEFYNKPIVAHLFKDEDGKSYRIGGHDSKWVITNNSMELIDETIPFGTIPESANIHKEQVTEPDGITVNTYLVMDVLLWTGRYNIMDAAYSDDVYFNQSCELSINEYHWQDNNILSIDDFTFSALCLLNKSDDKEKNVRPCFPSCRVERISNYSLNESKFKENYELLLENLKKYSLDDNSNSKNIINEEPKGEIKMDLKKFNEDLSKQTYKVDDKDVCKYRLLSASESKVYVLDVEDYKAYGFDYAITSEEDSEEKLVIDYESKTEMSLSATEKITEEGFEEFSISDCIDTESEKKTKDNTSILEESFNAKIDELKDAYEELSQSYSVASKKLEEYEAKEAEMQAEAHEKDIEELFSRYSEKLSKCAEFLVYKAKVVPAEVTVDEVNEKLTLMAGKFMLESNTKKNFSYTPSESGVPKKESIVTNKYGHLLDKYIK